MSSASRPTTSRTNRAFFSYARADAKLANWLWRELDRYRTPKSLIGHESAFGHVPPKLHPIFRDKEDLASRGRLVETLNAALEDSDALIVLCTPKSARSEWVNQEVLAFKSLGRIDRIFPVIGTSNPAADVERPTTDYLPPAIAETGLLAADLREYHQRSGGVVGDGREGGKLKLIAGLLGIPLDALVQRERHRQRAIRLALSAAALTFAALATAAAGLGWLAQRNADEAHATLLRSFSTRGRERLQNHDVASAARFALAGLRLIPENQIADRDEAAATLAAIVQATGEVTWLFPHGRPVKVARFYSSGNRLLTADGVARIWSTTTGRLVYSSPPQAASIQSASVSTDDHWIATGDSDGALTVRSAVNGHPERSLRLPGESFTSVAFSPDGTHVLAASTSGAAIRWSWSDGQYESLTGDQGHPVLSAEFSPDGKLIATSGQRGDCSATTTQPACTRPATWVWSAKTGNLVFALAGHIGGIRPGVNRALFSPNGALIATIGGDGVAIIWDARTGSLRHKLEASSLGILTAAFSPDSSMLVTGGEDRTARVWNVHTGALAEVLPHDDWVHSVAFSHDGTRIVTAGSDKVVRIWDALTGRSLSLLGGPEADVVSAAFSPNDRLVVGGGDDGVARIWPAMEARVIAQANSVQERAPCRFASDYLGAGFTSSAFSPDGRWVVTGSEDRTASVWDAVTAHRVATLCGHTGLVNSAIFSNDGSRIATVSVDGAAIVWNSSGRQLLGPLHADDRETELRAVVFSPDDQRLAAAGSTGFISLWDANSGHRVATPQSMRFGDQVYSLTYSPDGRQIVAGGGHGAIGMVMIWDAESGRRLVRFQAHDGLVSSVAFSHDGTRLVTAGRDWLAIVWDTNGGEPSKLFSLRGHQYWVERASFSPDDQRILTASDDSTAIVWDARDGRPMTRLLGHHNTLTAAFSPDGRRAVTAGWQGDNQLRIWDVHALTGPLADLQRYACNNLLGPYGRRFSKDEINADPLLRSEWRDADRDVCDGVVGVVPRTPQQSQPPS